MHSLRGRQNSLISWNLHSSRGTKQVSKLYSMSDGECYGPKLVDLGGLRDGTRGLVKRLL